MTSRYKHRPHTAGMRHSYVSGGPLNVPRTPVQRILLAARLARLKRESAQRRGETTR